MKWTINGTIYDEETAVEVYGQIRSPGAKRLYLTENGDWFIRSPYPRRCGSIETLSGRAARRWLKHVEEPSGEDISEIINEIIEEYNEYF